MKLTKIEKEARFKSILITLFINMFLLLNLYFVDLSSNKELVEIPIEVELQNDLPKSSSQSNNPNEQQENNRQEPISNNQPEKEIKEKEEESKEKQVKEEIKEIKSKENNLIDNTDKNSLTLKKETKKEVKLKEVKKEIKEVKKIEPKITKPEPKKVVSENIKSDGKAKSITDLLLKNKSNSTSGNSNSSEGNSQNGSNKEFIGNGNGGRKLVSFIPGTLGRSNEQNPPHNCTNERGTVVINYTVDKSGKVVSAYLQSGNASTCIINTAISWVKKYVRAEQGSAIISSTYKIEF